MRHDIRTTGSVVMALTDDFSLLLAIRETLEAPGLQILVPESSADAPARAKARQPLLILLDAEKVDAPSGTEAPLLEALKGSPYIAPVPVVVLAPAHLNEDRQLDLYRRGAHEIVVRPESAELLRKRLGALGRYLSPAEQAAETLEADGLVIDLRARKVTVDGRVVALTRKEFDLLNMLLRKRGIVAYTTHLYHTVWGYGESTPVDSHTVKVHISSLRSKLGPALGRKIVNLPGLGYRFDD